MRTLQGILALGVIIQTCKLTLSEYVRADFHGSIKETATPNTEVQFDNNIFIKDITKLNGGKVCGYTLYKSRDELPFTVVRLNKTTGEARLVLKDGYTLDYNRVHSYTFGIAAHDCIDGEHSPRLTVHVEVEPSTPEPTKTDMDPSWQQDSYTIEVEEGKLYDDILQLEVEGLPEEYAESCKFFIISSDVPFTIDNKDKLGVLRNTEKLDYSRQHNYILQVKAEGCGESEDKANKPLIINIQVKETCKQGWKDVDRILEYEPGKGIKLVAEKSSLKICEDKCAAKDITVKIKLNTDHIGKGCDRDTYSIQSQRKLCGASDEVVDLLPDPSQGQWTEKIPRDDGSEGDQIFYFDGKTKGIEVPAESFNHTLKQQFTVMTWMKHEKPTEDIDRKEHILCNSDGDGKNRHHYSLFVHHCKLVLLMRKEYKDGIDLNEFSPAEWRWHSPEICDGQWHHYAVSVEYPTVQLTIDGKRFVEEKGNPETIDDWALHPATKVHYTKLMIGACWMGTEDHLTQYFEGYLAGLSVLNGKTETDQVLKCLNFCQEKLDFHAMQDMDSGMSVAFNSEFSEITIQGGTASSVAKLLHKVGYINSRLYPTQGHRNIQIDTTVVCDDGNKVVIPRIESSIFVLPSAHPVITVSGTSVLTKEEAEFSHGIAIFRDVTIVSKTEAERKEEEYDKAQEDDIFADDSSPYKLDSCMVHVSPVMDFNNFNKEHFKYPENLVDQLMLEAFQNEDGLIISGAEKVSNYIQVLRQVKYYHANAEEINSRTFVLTCSELNGRFVSNEFKVQLDVVHDEEEAEVIPQANHVMNNKMVQPIKQYQPVANHIDKIENSAFMGSIGQGAKAGSAVSSGMGTIIIIVVCVAFLMFMIVLGVMRFRATQHRSMPSDVQMEEKPEMEWDNSALTITVNPMDQDNAYEENEMAGVHGDDTDSEDDMSDYHDDQDDGDSSEEEPDLRELKGRGLEWDESDLSKYQCKV